MTLELILFILYCICLRTSSIIHLVVMCLYTNCSQTLTHFSLDTFSYRMQTNDSSLSFMRIRE